MFAPNKLLAVVSFPATLAAVLWVPTPLTNKPTKIAGHFTMAYVKREALPVPDAAGHVLLLTHGRGSNRNTGPSDFMSGAEVMTAELVDLVQGNGPNQGYVIEAKGPDSVFVRVKGQVTTTMSPQGSPSTGATGAWTFARGTGQYGGISGSGTFKVGFTSETEFTVDWQGEYSK